MRTKLIYVLYRVCELLLLPVLLFYFLSRCLRDARYFHKFRERLGFLPASYQRTSYGAIWLHAVSVGEVISSIALLKRLRAQCPWAPLYVSCTTLAGRAMAEDKLRALSDGIFFAPIDYRFAVRAVLRRVRPAVVAVLETELWPNLYRETALSGAALVVINGRISDRTIARYVRLRWFFRAVLEWPGAILAQSERDRRRYLSLGAPPERVVDAGNLKYDFEPRQDAVPEVVRELIGRTAPTRIWIAASTMPPLETEGPDEADTVIEAFQELASLHPGLLLILVPRRPERFDSAAEKLESAGIRFLRRSRLSGSETLETPAALLLDSMGELSSLFSLADVVFMGGTLVQRGGHNPLEPAFFSKPIVAGPHMENFSAITQELVAGGAIVTISGASELTGAVDALLRDPGKCAAIGERARAIAGSQRGAVERVVREILRFHESALPHRPGGAALAPFVWLWTIGMRAKRARNLAHRRGLATPVISVGGIVMGGTGKTPFVLWLAKRLENPAILTRGYRRQSAERLTVLAPGSQASIAVTGDEAQILLRRGGVPVGIGASRYDAGRLLEAKFQPKVFLLDDGFQHWRLKRDLDIVLIDALDPFGGGALFPRGRLREPPDALARAGLIVITRAAPGRPLRTLEQELRRFNRSAPVFHSRVQPLCWVEAESGRQVPLDQLPLSNPAAFCGLANPETFWESLASLGISPQFRETFPDHHRYTVDELARLAGRNGVEALLTTGKDAMNLPLERLPFRLYWLQIGIEVDEESELIEMIRKIVR